MFENYSLADLWANLIKRKKLNLIAAAVIFFVMAIPTSYSAINSHSVARSNTSYSTYLMYKIDAPEKANELEVSTINNQYSNYFTRMIMASMNGAYLFNDVSNEQVSQYATEISSNVTQLRNSDYDFWEKKVTLSSLGDSTGFTVKILTTSQSLNELIQSKVEALVNQYKNTFSGVTVTQLQTITSSVPNENALGTASKFSIKQLLLRLIVVLMVAIFIVIIVNMALYLFNPTLNRAGDFKKYGISHVFEVSSFAMLMELIQYQREEYENLAVVTSNSNLAAKLMASSIPVASTEDYENLRQTKNYLFVEEFGDSRYGQFEKKLQELQNFDKTIIGVATLPL